MAPREVLVVPARLIVTLLLLGLSISLSSAQSDEELADIFRRGDVNRMEDIARTGDVRAETWLARMLQNRADHRPLEVHSSLDELRERRRAALADVLDRMSPARRQDLVRALAAFEAAADPAAEGDEDGLRSA